MSGSTVHMCYGSIRGEAEVPANVIKAPASGGWMKLTSCSLAAAVNYGQRYSLQLQGGGDVTPILVSKVTDASSTGMFREAILGKADQNAVIIFMRTGPDGPQEYMRLEIENCGIVDFTVDSSGDDRATEKFGISYGRMSVISWGFDASGQAAGQAMAMIENVS
ncbi:type VI secretion system tube protein Hcp [Roseomonas sp. CAU 1739]|uniref:type VI secretion system tube protein Hcp n=1 Tax=Roseomonas sp. CAU 1739 TaxID=3140364 RepID=UPI00325B7954